MKRLSSIAVLAGMLLAACSDTEIDRIPVEMPGGSVTATLDLKSDAELFRIDQAGNFRVEFLSTGGSVEIEARSSEACTCHTESDWLETRMDADTRLLTLTAEANSLRAARQGVVIVTAGSGEGAVHRSLIVSQNGTGTPGLTLAVPEFTFPVSEAYGPMSHRIEVTTDQDNWSFENRTNDWLHIEKEDGALRLTALPNAGLEPRSTEVTVVAGRGEQAVRRRLTVKQDAVSYIATMKDFSLSYNTLATRLPVLSNYDWQARSDAAWLSATRGADGYLLLSTETNRSSQQSRTATVTLVAAPTENNAAEAVIAITQYGYDPGAMIIETVNFSANNTICLPLSGRVDCTVDWGDGTIEKITSPLPTHEYETVGYHPVTVKGTVTALSTNELSSAQRLYLTGVAQWGKTGLTSLNRAFYGCSNLRFLAADTEHSLDRVTTFEEAFYGCERLQNIPPELFASAESATSFYGTFQGCKAIPHIPEGLFDRAVNAATFRFTFNGCTAIRQIPQALFARCPLATSFYGTFYGCTALQNVPEGLFAANPLADSFGFTFYMCSSLETLPESLFAACPDAMTFASVFRGCSSLREIPVGIFDNNRKVRIWSAAMANCTSLGGESPYTMIGGEKVHLYERADHPAEFTAPTTTASCFANSTGLSDYDRIPAAWR